MNVVLRRLVPIALLHGIDPMRLRSMTFLEFIEAVEKAKQAVLN